MGECLTRLAPSALVSIIEEILVQPMVLTCDGRVEIPQGPGLGIELDPKALDKYSVR